MEEAVLRNKIGGYANHARMQGGSLEWRNTLKIFMATEGQNHSEWSKLHMKTVLDTLLG